jgi:hypothetical protein
MTAVLLTHRHASRASKKDLAELKADVRLLNWISGPDCRHILG